MNAAIYSSETKLNVAKMFKTRLSYPVKQNLSKSKSITKLKIRRI